jgi:hypothetical protein
MGANEKYKEVLSHLEENLEHLKEKIKKHSQKQSGEPHHWGYVGDISYVNEKVENILEFIV